MNRCLPECILFDLDGTLIHSLPGIEHSIRSAFASCRIPIHITELATMIGSPISDILASIGNIDDEATLRVLNAEFRRSYDSEGWMKTEIYPGALDVLRALKLAGHRLFVVSNKPIHIATKILERSEIARYFEAILTRDSRTPAYLSKAEMMMALADGHAFDLNRALMVGDTTEDGKASAEVGAAFAFIAHGYGKIEPGISSVVSFRLDELSDLLPMIPTELVHDR
jgi:phosphoglycolate phosphatase